MEQTFEKLKLQNNNRHTGKIYNINKKKTKLIETTDVKDFLDKNL